MKNTIKRYLNDIKNVLDDCEYDSVISLADDLLNARIHQRLVFICGNGGSAGNAIHLANDFIYGAGVSNGGGLRVEALSANAAVITCLANDLGYDRIYSEQLKVKGNSGDILKIGRAHV